MDELANIRAFIDVVEAGSFSASARNQGIAVSTVARQVKALEDELGIRLVQRNTRNHSLTQVGQMFYERVAKLNRELIVAKSEAMASNSQMSGLIRVSLRNPVATTLIIPALQNFLEQYPEIRIDLKICDEREDLIAHEIDVAVWLGTLEDSDFVIRQLTPSRRVICASPKYLERHGTPQTPQDLKQHNCLLYKRQAYDDVWYFYEHGIEHRVPVIGSLQSDDGLALLTAALNNIGVIMINERTVKKYISSGELQPILLSYEVKPARIEAPLYVAFPSRFGMSRKVRLFVDFLVDLFSQDGQP